MEQQILSIIKKVRQMYRFDDRYKGILEMTPTINVVTNQKCNKVYLESIMWDWYDRVCATSTEIIYMPEYGNHRTIIKYKDWDDLLSL